jgi:ribosomal protein S18 acetylase RimI-like enzyme
MNYRILDWDTRFFGIRVAQLTVADATDSQSLSDALEQSDADVVYVFVPAAAADRYLPVLERHSGRFYDRKVTFVKHVDPAFAASDPSISEITTESGDLLNLAYASGHLSRFFLDPGFHPYFKALYGEWIRKALRAAESRVFALSDSSHMLAMVSAAVENGVGAIGLLAIAEDGRGQGLALRLLKHCEAYYGSLGARTCRVVTQNANLGACRLYLKAGYRIESEQDVWHIWKA